MVVWISHNLFQGIPDRNRGGITVPDTETQPVRGAPAPATPTSGLSVPASTGSSSSAAGGKCLILFFILFCKLIFFFLNSFADVLTHALSISQPLELPKKSATVSTNATADPAKCCLTSCPAAGDRPGKPRPAAGEAHK